MTDVQKWKVHIGAEKVHIGAEVLVVDAPDHSRPEILQGLELPARAIVQRPAIDEHHGGLWWVKINPPFEGPEVQVHADQLLPGDGSCPECGSEPGIHNIACKRARRLREAASGKDPAAHWTTDQMLATLLRRTVVSAGGGAMGIAMRPDGDWVVSAEYGQEMDEGEPTGMVGAATYGTGSLRAALMRAGADAGIWVFDDSPEPSERQQRILIVEAEHPAELNVGAVQGSMSLLADADEAYAFSGDKAACIKHRDFDISADPFQVAVAIQRRPDPDPEVGAEWFKAKRLGLAKSLFDKAMRERYAEGHVPSWDDIDSEKQRGWLALAEPHLAAIGIEP